MIRRRAPLPAVALSLAAAATSFALASTAFAVNEHPKGGDFQANFKLGPAIKASRQAPRTQFAMQLEIMGAIIDDDGYLGFAPQFQFGDFTIINLPMSFQYDIHLPVKNLYIYPRIQAGLGMAPDAPGGYYAFTLQPEFGVKYQVHENFHAGMEPLSLPMYFGDPVFLQYRIYFVAGADF
jgi:hypothetical protein